MFLIPQDYDQIIRSEILTTISGGKTYNIDAAEQTARAEMESYLAGRFDVARIFVDVQQWTPEGQFPKDSVVYAMAFENMQLIFQAVQDTQGTNLTEVEFWKAGDPRNALIRTYLLDMAVYHVHAAIPHKAIPELRVMRYDAAISWLEKVSKGQLTPNLPAVPDAPDGGPADGVQRLGSRPKLRHDR